MKSYTEFLCESVGNVINIDSVFYGNSTKDLKEISDTESKIKSWFVENGFFEKICNSAPLNSSQETKNDIISILGKMESVSADDLTFSRFVEEDLPQAFIDFLFSKGIEETMDNYFYIDRQVEPLCFSLKHAINRPRPFQLAYYMKIDLYPLIHTDACSSSYPGGHALTSFVLSEYYSRKYPSISSDIKQFAQKVAESREKMGIHFSSDTKIAKEISDIIWSNNLIEE